MLTCRQLAVFTRLIYSVFLSVKTETGSTRTARKRKGHFEILLSNFAVHFFATLSSEVVGRGRRHVCVCADSFVGELSS